MTRLVHGSVGWIGLAMVVLALVPQVRSQCSSCVDLQAFGCNVCYDSCAQNKSQQLLSCDYTYCSDYSYDENGTSTCIGYETKRLPESQCFHQCCESDQTSFSVEELNRCDQKSKQRITIVIAVCCSIAGVILIIILACCGCCSKLAGCCRGLLDYVRDCCGLVFDCMRYVCLCRCLRQTQSSVGGSAENGEVSKAELVVGWEEEDRKQILNDEGTVCAICLNNLANTSGGCGHCYHMECIRKWYNRNPQCPVCRSEEVRWVKFYCRGCCQRFIRFDLSLNKRIDECIKNAKGPNCSVCQ